MDISVLILFFNRPDHLRQVFNAVREARPARLFLYQDGPRNEADMPLIEACREVVAEVDWPCEVHRNYQETNAGCDPSGFNAHRWAFSQTDRCVVLEDDVVPVPSFFAFCHEMLERYAEDQRVGVIAGFNHEEQTTDVESDYFFTSNFSIWGWASWARVVNTWEGDYGFWRNEGTQQQLRNLIADRRWRSELPRIFTSHASSGKEFFETIFQANLLLNSQLAIVPRVNMIRNVGADPNSTHFDSSIETMPKAYRRIFTMQSHELQWPLRHPQYVVDHVAFLRRVYKTNAWDNPKQKIRYSLEELWNNIRRGRFSAIAVAVQKRFMKLIGRKSFR